MRGSLKRMEGSACSCFSSGWAARNAGATQLTLLRYELECDAGQWLCRAYECIIFFKWSDCNVQSACSVALLDWAFKCA